MANQNNLDEATLPVAIKAAQDLERSNIYLIFSLLLLVFIYIIYLNLYFLGLLQG